MNATSVRDDVLVQLRPGQMLVDLPYPDDRDRRSGPHCRRTVVSGLEVLLAQGAASFELWTGEPAPVDAMRRALGLPA